MRTCFTHFGVPLGSQTGWWDDQKSASKLTTTKKSLAIFHTLSPDSDSLVTTCMLSGSGNNSTDFLMSLESAQNATVTVYKMKSMYS